VSRLVNKFSISDAAFDIGGRLGPAKGLAILIPVAEPIHDRGFEAAYLSKLPRRKAWLVMVANQRSTRLSHEGLVGVKCNRMRGCAASHSFTAGACGFRSYRRSDAVRVWGNDEPAS